MNRTRTILTAALTLALTVGAGTAAFAQIPPSVSANPSSVMVGETATVTAEGLGDLTTASFGLDSTPGGTLSTQSQPNGATSVQATVSDGTAEAQFTSTQEGTFTIAVSDGETVLAATTVTATAATQSPTPSATSTTSATAAPVTTDSRLLPAVIGIIVIAVLLVVAGVAIWVLVARRRKKSL